MESGLVDPAQDAHYYWLAADGARLSGTEAELRTALSHGSLGPSTLVWRAGWPEWLPANRVPEFASAIAKPPAPASVTTDASQRPTVRELRRPPAATPGAHDPARDTLAPSSFGTLGPARRPASARSSRPPPPPQRSRAPMPTLSEEHGAAPATATLRPPGAVPPPARGVPVPALDAAPRATMTPIPAFGPPGGRLDLSPAPPLPAVVNRALLADMSAVPSQPPLESTLEVVPHVPAEARRTPVEQLVAPPAPADDDANGATAQSGRPRQQSLLKIGRIGFDSRTVVMALSALSGALLATLVGLALSRSPRDAPAPGTSPSASSSNASPAPSPAPAALGCHLALPAARIAASVERSVPPYAATFGADAGLALGFAETKTKGVGVRLNPNTLDISPVFEEDGKDAVRGVVPLTRSGSLAFFADRDDHVLRSPHTIDEIPPFTLGVSGAGFSRVVAGSTSLVWELDPRTKITEPRSAPLAGYGYGVTFRRGGQSGAILLGFVASDGEKKSELAEIPGAPKFLGTPVIAGSSAGALIAFAGRESTDAVWKLFVSYVAPGAAPGPARPLVEGSGAGAISPALSALDSNRWLVQWTEGSSAQYHVHAQSFGADLSPIGQPIAVSPKGANAGQGAVALFANGAVTLFVLTTAGHDELWGATLACP